MTAQAYLIVHKEKTSQASTSSTMINPDEQEPDTRCRHRGKNECGNETLWDSPRLHVATTTIPSGHDGEMVQINRMRSDERGWLMRIRSPNKSS